MVQVSFALLLFIVGCVFVIFSYLKCLEDKIVLLVLFMHIIFFYKDKKIKPLLSKD